MNKIYPTIITENNIVVVKGSNRLIANQSHPNFGKILERVRAGRFSNIEQLFNIKERVEKIFNVVINNNRIFYSGKEVHSVLGRKILTFMSQGLPYRPLVKFMNKLMENPDQVSRDTLYAYLEKQLLPIEADGDFIATKAIRNNMTDKWTGTIKNVIGKSISMPREQVNKSPNECAGAGLHCGSSTYVRSYGSGDDKYILVKVNPKDVVVVPQGGAMEKIRLCRYKVLKTIDREALDFCSDYAPKNPQYKDIPKADTKSNHLSQKRDKSGRFTKSK